MSRHSSIQQRMQRAAIGVLVAIVVLICRGHKLQAQCNVDDMQTSGCETQPFRRSGPQAAPADFSIGPVSPTQDSVHALQSADQLSNGPTYVDQTHLNLDSERRRTQHLQPEPLTEFQRFVAATTGQMIPIFGADLFANRPVSFAHISSLPAPTNMAIGPGDELRIRIWGQVNFNTNVVVDRNGEIYLPKVGAVHVAGLPFAELAPHLRANLSRVFRNFELSANLGQIHSIQVYVTGMAHHPGLYTVSALSTLVDAAFASGGPSAAGSMRHVELKRGGQTVSDFDLYALIASGDKTGDRQLESGDILYFPPAGAEVALLGSVRQTGIYELRGSETSGQLLETAGGRTALAANERISVERMTNNGQLTTLSISGDAASLTTKLRNGDIVRVDSIASSFADAVTLRGSVAHAGRFPWHAGLRLCDILPNRDAVMSRDYQWGRTQLGLPSEEFGPEVKALQPPTVHGARTPRSDMDDVLAHNPRKYAQESKSMVIDMSAPANGTAASGQSSPLLSEPGALGGNDSYSSIAEDEHSVLFRPANQTDWNYAVVERTDPATMRTRLIPFDLGKLVLEHDASQNLLLQSGDVVTIFSQNDLRLPVDKQTKYVRLDGEFAHPGIYSVEPGDTLRSLVEKAGGLTAKAYLYGAVFTRKSTQLLEQRRLNDYADQIEHQLVRNYTAMTASGTQEQLQSRNEMLDKLLLVQLRQQKATGRIVLNLAPKAHGSVELPTLALEDGDRLVVPSEPATVQVIGAVANQNAFLYRAGETVNDYLRLAGGMTRDADRRQIYVLRADGSVDGRGPGSLFSSSIGKLKLYAGDTVVAPEKRISAGAMRGILNWTQMISGMSLSAAVINAIR